MSRACAAVLGLILALLWVSPAAGAPEDAAPDRLVPVGGPEVVLQAAEIEEARATAVSRLAVLAHPMEDGRALDEIEEMLGSYEDYVADRVEAVFFEDQLVAIRSRIATHQAELDSLREEMAESLVEVKEIQARWSALDEAWSRQGLADVLTSAERNDLRRSIRQIRAEVSVVAKTVTQARESIVELQARARAVDLRARELDDQLDAATSATRAGWAQRHSPAIWAADAGVGPDEDRAAAVGNRLFRIEAAFFDRTRPVWVLHGIALALIVVLASRLRRTAEDEVTRSLFVRAIPLAAFSTGLVFSPMYQPMPPLLDAGLWAAVAIGGFRLATAAFGTVRLHRVGAGLAVAYPLVRIADVVVPSTLALRWTLIVTAGAGAIGLAIRARQLRRSEERRWPLILGLGAIALVVSAATETVGFTALSRPVFGATIRTGFVIVVYVAGRRVLRGVAAGLGTWLSTVAAERWRTTAAGWARNLGWVMEAGLLVGAVLDVLYTWRLIPSPPEALAAIRDAKFGVLGIEITLANIGLAVVTLYLARQISRVVELSLEATVLRRANVEGGTGDSIKTLVRYMLLALGGLVALGMLGIEPRSIAIVAGGLGVGIGFGLQSVVADLTSGIILLFEGSIRTGDAVIIDGRWGQVRHIGLRSTVVTMVDQSELVCPNSSLTSNRIENWTLTSRRARVFCKVGIAYGSDVELAYRTLLEVAGQEEDVMAEPLPEVLFMEFGDNALGLELRVWTEKGEERIQLRSRLLKAIDVAFRRAEIEIAFPQRDLHLKSIHPRLAELLTGRTDEEAHEKPSEDDEPAQPTEP